MAVTPDTLLIDGVNLGTYGLIWSSRIGWRSFPEAEVLTHQYPANVGELFQGREESKARILTVSGIIEATSMSALYANIDLIAAALRSDGTTPLQIGFSDDARVIFGHLRLSDITDVAPGALVPKAPYTFRFSCPDPLRYDTATQNINAATDLPIGTAPVRPKVTIHGTASNPTTLEVRDKDNNAVSSFTMAAALGAGESWIIDSELFTVQHDDGVGGVTSALDDFSGEFPVLDPKDADFAASDWGQIVVTAGSPSDVDIEYEKTWM